jgi:hypothetical protein
MYEVPALQLSKLAAVSSAGDSIHAFVTPILAAMLGLAALFSTFFLINGGIAYITSSGQPDKLEHAKVVIRNALIGLALIIAAGTLTAILTHAYQSASGSNIQHLPILTTVKPVPTSGGLVDVLVKAIVGLFQHIIQSAAQPFLDALTYFTRDTPLMGDNSSVFNLWLAIVGITDSLFVLVIVLLGFHIMSYASLGLEEIEFKHLLPQLGLSFLAINTSIFGIDAIISLSNAMIHALYAAFPSTTVWQALEAVASQSTSMGLVALMILVVFLIFAVILLVYYVTRLVTLYLGAILSPLVILLWLLPGFKDFAVTAAKTYLAVIFVLFIHVIILLLAASIFAGMLISSSNNALDPVMAAIVGVATLIALLKTQGVLNQLAYVSLGPKAMRKLSGQFINSISYINRFKTRSARNTE